jgi:transcriptional regulator with XRE-family HTH domain
MNAFYTQFHFCALLRIYSPKGTVLVMAITPAQSRAARALLDMTQSSLALASEVSLRTIVNFEAGRAQLIPATISALQRALEDAGIEFIASNGGGPGVRLRAKPHIAARSKK